MNEKLIEATKLALTNTGFAVSHGPTPGTFVGMKEMGTPWQKLVLIQHEEGTGIVNVHIHLRRHQDEFNAADVVGLIEGL